MGLRLVYGAIEYLNSTPSGFVWTEPTRCNKAWLGKWRARAESEYDTTFEGLSWGAVGAKYCKRSKEITLYLLLSLLIASYLDTWQCCYGCGFANHTIQWFVTMIVAKWRGPPLISRRKRFSRSIIKELQHDVKLIEECKVRKKRWV